MGLARCVHSALQNDEMDGGTAAVTPASGKVGIDCPKSGGSSPTGREKIANFTTYKGTLLIENIHNNSIF